MEKLWSPWRSNYIKSFKHKTGDEKCVFCSAVNDDMNSDDSLVVYRGKKMFIMLNLYPYNSGHLLIILNRHLSDFRQMNSDEKIEIMESFDLSIKALDLVMKPQGYNLGTNIGKAAGAGIEQHLHFHILPRWIGDTNFMPAIGKVKVISQDLLNTKKDLIKAFNEIVR